MGPMLMTGLMTFAAAIALGLIASATRAPVRSIVEVDPGTVAAGAKAVRGAATRAPGRPNVGVEAGSAADSAKAVRGAATVCMALCSGLGVLGTVVGLLAILLLPLSEPGAAPFVSVPATLGAGTGLVLIGRARREVDRPRAAYAVVNIISMGVLGLVVAMLAIVISEEPPGHVNDLVFILLGLVGAAAAIALGVTSSRALESMRGVDEATVKTLLRAHLVRAQLLQVVGIAAVIVAILLLVTARS